ncbi:hypothetical protein Lser_V15G13787 [Lactuca serriola]
MMVMVMAIPRNIASFIAAHPLNKLKLKGIFTTLSSFISLGNPSSSLGLVMEICYPKTIFSQLHSSPSFNRQTLRTYPRSVFDKITKLKDALKLFDEMTQQQPLPTVVEFTQLLQAVTKMKHYSCSIEVFKQMNAICVPVNVYTISIVIKCCCQMYSTSEGFAVLGYGYNSSLLNGYCKKLKMEEAMHLFNEMIQKGMKPDCF